MSTREQVRDAFIGVGIGLCIVFISFALFHYLPVPISPERLAAEQTIRQHLTTQFTQQIEIEFPNLPQSARAAVIDQKVDDFIEQHLAEYEMTVNQLIVDSGAEPDLRTPYERSLVSLLIVPVVLLIIVASLAFPYRKPAMLIGAAATVIPYLLGAYLYVSI